MLSPFCKWENQGLGRVKHCLESYNQKTAEPSVSVLGVHIIPKCLAVQLFVAPWTVTCQDRLSMGFSRQEYSNGTPCPPSGDLPDPGIKPKSLSWDSNLLHCKQILYQLSHQGSPMEQPFMPVSEQRGARWKAVPGSSRKQSPKPRFRKAVRAPFPRFAFGLPSLPMSISTNLTKETKTEWLSTVYTTSSWLTGWWQGFKYSSLSLRPTDCSLPGSSVQGILQVRILQWVTFPSPADLPNPGMEPMSPALQVDSLLSEPPEKPSVLMGKWLVTMFKYSSLSCTDTLTYFFSHAWYTL